MSNSSAPVSPTSPGRSARRRDLRGLGDSDRGEPIPPLTARTRSSHPGFRLWPELARRRPRWPLPHVRDRRASTDYQPNAGEQGRLGGRRPGHALHHRRDVCPQWYGARECRSSRCWPGNEQRLFRLARQRPRRRGQLRLGGWIRNLVEHRHRPRRLRPAGKHGRRRFARQWRLIKRFLHDDSQT